MSNQARPFTESDAELTRKIGIVDTHNDFAIGILKERFGGNKDSLGEYWVPRFRSGGVRLTTAPISSFLISTCRTAHCASPSR